jgi:hypothetical protein
MGALIAILAVFMQAVVPSLHAWESREAPVSDAWSHPAVPLASGGPSLGALGHDCDGCPICKALRGASRVSTDLPALAFCGEVHRIECMEWPKDAAPVRIPDMAMLARGPPGMC